MRDGVMKGESRWRGEVDKGKGRGWEGGKEGGNM